MSIPPTAPSDEEPVGHLLGYDPLGPTGFALACFGWPEGNTVSVAQTFSPGHPDARIDAFLPYQPAAMVVLPNDGVPIRIGDPWLDVFLWDGHAYAGTPAQIWHDLSDQRDAIAASAPLSLLTLAQSVAKLDTDECVRGAVTWMASRFGLPRARAWRSETLLRGILLRRIRRHLGAAAHTAPMRQALMEIELTAFDAGVSVRWPSLLTAAYQPGSHPLDDVTHAAAISADALSLHVGSTAHPVLRRLPGAEEFWRLIKEGDELALLGRTTDAKGKFSEAQHIAQSHLLRGDDPSWSRNLSVSHGRIGDVLRAQGDDGGALAAYRADMEISARLAASDPTNSEWQLDLSISHERIGDALRAQEGAAGTPSAYPASTAISEPLAASDPANGERQRDLSIRPERIGDALHTQGDGAGAIAAYRASLAIRERLAASDPAKSEWQYGLALIHGRIGDVLRTRKEDAEAIAAYRKVMAICERLATSDPTNSEWQHDLSVSHNRIGDIMAAQGDIPAAVQEYRRSRLILAALAALDPANVPWRNDLTYPDRRIAELEARLPPSP